VSDSLLGRRRGGQEILIDSRANQFLQAGLVKRCVPSQYALYFMCVPIDSDHSQAQARQASSADAADVPQPEDRYIDTFRFQD